MPRYQHGQKVISQLVGRNLVSGGNEESQDAWVALIDVPLLKPCLQPQTTFYLTESRLWELGAKACAREQYRLTH